MKRRVGVKFVRICLVLLAIMARVAEAGPVARRAGPATGAAAGAASAPTPVVTIDGASLPYRMEDGVKVFHLVAQKVKQEVAPGMVIDAWGYNGRTPGPTIEAVEGDRVRILVTNELPEATSVHWHGVLLPAGMDGVAGLTQRAIQPGETWAYEFTLRQSGTQMYHPHSDEMTQMALGMMGFFVIHPRTAPRRVDRDYAIFLHEWDVPPGGSAPNPITMLDFNLFTLNGRAYPGTSPLVARTGERVRLRLANVSMDNHPIHLHGLNFVVTGTDGGPAPESSWRPETTVDVPPGSTRTIEFVPQYAGDWPLHCHKNHHTMNQMGHDVPNLIGVSQAGLEARVQRHLPGYMAMGERGMGEMAEMDMGGPPNTLRMMTGTGPFGPIGMGGMFTLLKVRDRLEPGADAGWYPHPEGSIARPVDAARKGPDRPGHGHE